MKLQNKKTGEIIDLNKGSIKDVGLGTSIQLQAIDRYNKPIWNYNSLAELNEDWEDYEEPVGYWYIDFGGDILSCVEPFDDETKENRKSIGNYFETEEEAEKAVEKLKAWKRLKDAGFRFGGWETDSDGDLRSVLCNRKDRVQFDNDETLAMAKDLDLLFGGEK